MEDSGLGNSSGSRRGLRSGSNAAASATGATSPRPGLFTSPKVLARLVSQVRADSSAEKAARNPTTAAVVVGNEDDAITITAADNSSSSPKTEVDRRRDDSDERMRRIENESAGQAASIAELRVMTAQSNALLERMMAMMAMTSKEPSVSSPVVTHEAAPPNPPPIQPLVMPPPRGRGRPPKEGSKKGLVGSHQPPVRHTTPSYLSSPPVGDECDAMWVDAVASSQQRKSPEITKKAITQQVKMPKAAKAAALLLTAEISRLQEELAKRDRLLLATRYPMHPTRPPAAGHTESSSSAADGAVGAVSDQKLEARRGLPVEKNHDEYYSDSDRDSIERDAVLNKLSRLKSDSNRATHGKGEYRRDVRQQVYSSSDDGASLVEGGGSLGQRSGLTTEESATSSSVSTPTTGNSTGEGVKEEGNEPALEWGAIFGDVQLEAKLPPAWIEPPTGVSPGKPWKHPLQLDACIWGPQMSIAAQPGSSPTVALTLKQAEKREGLVMPVGGLVLVSYRLPPGDGSEDFSRKRISSKTVSAVGYTSDEVYLSMSLVNEGKSLQLNHFASMFPKTEFPGSLDRLENLIAVFGDGVQGVNVFDDPDGVRDARLGLQPSNRAARGQEMRNFQALVKQYIFDRFLNPSHAGAAANKYCVTRQAQATVFVIHRLRVVFATRDVRALNRDFYKDWSQYTQANEEARGEIEMTSLLMDSLRLLGIACPDCENLGSCNLFCRDPKCVSQSKRSAKASAVKGAAGSKEHFQDAKNSAARQELKLASGAAVTWANLASDWQPKFLASYAAKHSLGAAWTGPPSIKSVGPGVRGEGAGPGAYWNRQSEVKGLKPMARQFEGAAAMSLGGGYSA